MRSCLRIWLFCLCLALLTGAFFRGQSPPLLDSYRGQDVKTILAAIPKSDRKKIEHFFRECFQNDYFDFVLFGQKPMAFGGVIENINPFICLGEEEQKLENCRPHPYQKFLFYLSEVLSSDRLKSVAAYKTWRKYENFFPSTQFTLFYTPRVHSGVNDLMVFLIHNDAFIEIVNQHLVDFQKVLGPNISAERLLQGLVEDPGLFDPVINHDGLLGTLLGFGRNNAFLFRERSFLKSIEEQDAFNKKNHFYFVWEENLEETDEKIHFKDLPCFIADARSFETQMLRKKYLQAKKRIITYYENKDFLETTLRLLVGENAGLFD